MPSPSKENKILELFFEYPSNYWHFEEILKKTGLSRDKANKWLKRMMNEGIVKRVKEKGKMPYYIGDYENPSYKNRKRLYALTQFYESGFLDHLQTLKEAKTVILFGSMTRSDWYNESDIDLFIYGKCDDLDLYRFQSKLKRDIQLFCANTKKELEKMGPALLKNILRGNFIKGTADFVEVNIIG